MAIRNEPVQARSTARLSSLLDAAAAAVQEIGYERLTTAMVAERAGASIGTVYRYFPDRIAVLQALAARNFERLSESMRAELSRESHDNWVAAMAGAFEVFVDTFRNEPGFRSLRIGDVIDLRPPTSPQTFKSRIADEMLQLLVTRFGVTATDAARLAFESAIEITDALVARAFARDDSGDPAFIEQGGEVVHAMMAKHFGDPQPK